MQGVSPLEHALYFGLGEKFSLFPCTLFQLVLYFEVRHKLHKDFFQIQCPEGITVSLSCI